MKIVSSRSTLGHNCFFLATQCSRNLKKNCGSQAKNTWINKKRKSENLFYYSLKMVSGEQSTRKKFASITEDFGSIKKLRLKESCKSY